MQPFHASAVKTSSPPRSTTPLRRIHVAHHQTSGSNQIFLDQKSTKRFLLILKKGFREQIIKS
ncbi:unnamed protein product [Brassica oleracea var. botrytis]